MESRTYRQRAVCAHIFRRYPAGDCARGEQFAVYVAAASPHDYLRVGCDKVVSSSARGQARDSRSPDSFFLDDPGAHGFVADCISAISLQRAGRGDFAPHQLARDYL